MTDVLLSPIRLNELELLIENSIERAIGKIISVPISSSDELLTIKEAAHFLSLRVPTLYSLVHRQEIPVNKRPGSKRLYFSKRELEQWIKAGRRKTLDEITLEADNFISRKKVK